MLGRAVFTGKLLPERRGPASHRLAHSLANADFVLAARVASAAGRPARLAAHQAPHARPHPMPRARNARRGRVELFLLRRDSENERRHRHHRAIHRAGLGAAVCSCPRTAETFAAESRRRRRGHHRHRPDDRHRRRRSPQRRFASTATVSSPPCWPRFPSPSTTLADTASWPASTAGASWSGR